MLALTPSERRGALVLVLLLLIGAGHDLWRLHATRALPFAAGDGGRDDAGRADSVPASGAPGPPPPSVASPRGARDSLLATARGPAIPGPGTPIDLNRAGAEELDRLPGVGPVLAQRIVIQRRRFGPFQGLDDLRAVRGVGPRLLERIRPWATVGHPPVAAARDREEAADSSAGGAPRTRRRACKLHARRRCRPRNSLQAHGPTFR